MSPSTADLRLFLFIIVLHDDDEHEDEAAAAECADLIIAMHCAHDGDAEWRHRHREGAAGSWR